MIAVSVGDDTRMTAPRRASQRPVLFPVIFKFARNGFVGQEYCFLLPRRCIKSETRTDALTFFGVQSPSDERSRRTFWVLPGPPDDPLASRNRKDRGPPLALIPNDGPAIVCLANNLGY